VPVAIIYEDLKAVLRDVPAVIELTSTDIMIERRLSEAIVRCVRVTGGHEDPPIFVMSYGDNDMDCRVYGKREFILRVIKQFVVELQPSSAIPRE
jgi:hypothetical protein